ncbi:MAG TPA: SNF2-related protein [Chloroflexota bacterium]|nr:SNF2-related protein [Chloroflexota bacterium]
MTAPLLHGVLNERPAAFAADGPLAYVPGPEADHVPATYPILVYQPGASELVSLLRERRFAGWPWFRLALQAAELGLLEPPDDLLTPVHLAERWKEVGVVPYQHQLETARRVITELCGRAILADEVGLGKTIEAGIITKEYLLRRLATRILILVPAGLCRQWALELQQKFDLQPCVVRGEWDWERSDLLITSLDLAKSVRQRSRVLAQSWDLVIVDEAHKLKNSRSQNWLFVSALRSKYLLMLTATPVQNDLHELYNLITLLRPGQLGTYREFRRRYAAGPRQPKNAGELRELLRNVMVRNRRGDDTVRFTKRLLHSLPVELSPQEAELYRAITFHLRQVARQARDVGQPMRNLLPLITLQREACSSSFAVILTLDKMRRSTSDGDLQERLTHLLNLALAVSTSAKADAVEHLLATIPDKVLLFTEYRGTAAFLAQRLSNAGRTVLGFDGHLSASRKDYARFLFQRSADVLISTESGGEGLNFQFCHHIVNFDLPWNPMRIEQRIGRVHRLGQTEDVQVYNLATRGTVEDRLVRLLFEKLNLFSEVMGDLAELLGDDLAEGGFQQRLMGAVLEADDDEDEEAGFLDLERELSGRLQSRANAGRAWWDVL